MVRGRQLKIGVAYLDRWGNPPEFSARFLDGLLGMTPGANFDLVWQYKGYPDDQSNPALRAFQDRSQTPIHEIRYGEDVFQFKMAFDLAARSDFDRLLFFISWSRILAPGWLRIYLDAFDRIANCGVVGATGSYETIDSSHPFPNVHVRTNAFMVERTVFLRLEPGPMDTLFSGRFFEAGPASMTRQIQARGLSALVVDRHGRAFTQEGWAASRTFRSGQQEGLLVADNRTDDFATGSPERREMLARLAFGDRAIF
jgi:hypothetical protein